MRSSRTLHFEREMYSGHSYEQPSRYPMLFLKSKAREVKQERANEQEQRQCEHSSTSHNFVACALISNT